MAAFKLRAILQVTVEWRPRQLPQNQAQTNKEPGERRPDLNICSVLLLRRTLSLLYNVLLRLPRSPSYGAGHCLCLRRRLHRRDHQRFLDELLAAGRLRHGKYRA